MKVMGDMGRIGGSPALADLLLAAVAGGSALALEIANV